MGGVPAEPGGQVAARPGPLVRAADAGWVLHRQRGGIDLVAVVPRQPGRQDGPDLLERTPQPAGSSVDLALARQDREEMAPVRATSARKADSLRRPSRHRTPAMASSSASVQAGAGPGRRGIRIAPDRIRSWTST